MEFTHLDYLKLYGSPKPYSRARFDNDAEDGSWFWLHFPSFELKLEFEVRLDFHGSAGNKHVEFDIVQLIKIGSIKPLVCPRLGTCFG